MVFMFSIGTFGISCCYCAGIMGPWPIGTRLVEDLQDEDRLKCQISGHEHAGGINREHIQLRSLRVFKAVLSPKAFGHDICGLADAIMRLMTWLCRG